MPIRCSTAETRTEGCGCFRLRSSDVSESPKIYKHKDSQTHTAGTENKPEIIIMLKQTNRKHKYINIYICIKHEDLHGDDHIININISGTSSCFPPLKVFVGSFYNLNKQLKMFLRVS